MPSAIRFWVCWTHLSRTPVKCKKTAPKACSADEIRLSIPASQPLPAAFEEYFGDVRAGAVRGGVRGSAITPEFVAYEQRQAAVMGMPLKAWADNSAKL